MPLNPMNQANTISMRAPKERIFEAAANLELWPSFLPHYRYIHYFQRGSKRNVVKMAAYRDFIPIAWISEQIIDRDLCEIRFKHLSFWSKGMEVVWKFEQSEGDTRVSIVHDLRFRIPTLAFAAEPIIGGFFIGNIANKTLRCMKTYVETR
jgi:ribosome-associated toxin RatA of RatAB toxin-antitoxin module